MVEMKSLIDIIFSRKKNNQNKKEIKANKHRPPLKITQKKESRH